MEGRQLRAHLGDSRRAGRATTSELVAWDVGLLLLVIALVVADHSLTPSAASPDPGDQAAVPNSSQEAEDPTPPRQRRTQRTDGGEPEQPQSTETPSSETGSGDTTTQLLDKLRGEVASLEDAGDALGALAAWRSAPPAVRQLEVWRSERTRLLRGLAAADQVTALLPEAQVLADFGRPDLLEGLAPNLTREPRLRAELDRARRFQDALARDTGFRLDEFQPNWTRHQGRRCSLEGDATAEALKQVGDGIDAVVGLGEELVGGPGATVADRFQLRVLGAQASPKPAPQGWVVLYRRDGESDQSLELRGRHAAALWVVAQLTGPEGAPAWVREGAVRALASAVPAAGGRPTLTPVGEAWRRQFLARPPAGDGTTLRDLLAADRPAPDRSWALLHFALAGLAIPEARDQALRVHSGLRAALGRGGASLAELSPEHAAALERAWVQALETP
jgi:hypothetical protein